jgi:EAL domain-containing protein (putative c-di-GMP-specific phosphodiesterase class I)/ActR/RegA family two-component response regulator
MRILILDDDPAVGQTIQWIAESLGFEAEFTTRPSDFFASLERTAPDAITIDLAMPELDGVEVMRLLAQRKSKARIIISSGMGSRVLDAARRSAAEHGLSIAGVLPKPISREALRVLLGEVDDPAPSAEEHHAATVTSAPPPAESPVLTRSDLEAALEHRQFVMAYQPKINCKSGQIAGFEALVRWRHPTHGLIMPDAFIPIAEQSGLIDPLTAQIVDQSLAWFTTAFPQSGLSLSLSLNLSARSLIDLELADKLSAICLRFQLPTERIVLEVTESSAMIDPVLSLDLLTRLRVKGFQLSIDDFGTGFSSMVQLVRLPFSEIKVDKSFVLHASQSQESRTVIKSIVELGHSLGLTVTAEGVEDQRTLDYLNTLGCDLAQGYLIARPMPGDAARQWAASRTAN